MFKMGISSPQEFLNRKQKLQTELKKINGRVRIKKSTSSNLFRYSPRKNQAKQMVSLQSFNHILQLDSEQQTLEIEGLTTYQQIVEYTTSRGFLPTIAPELKHITIGGATVGIGIESAGFRHGFVHDGLVEAEVLLHNGKIVICRADNEYSDLFHGLPNSYGSLGYIIRAKIKLIRAKPFVKIENESFTNVDSYIDAMQAASQRPDIDFLEGLIFSKNEFYLTTSKFIDECPVPDDIYKKIYYKMIRNQAEVTLRTEDYIFRFDPDWFWNIPETGFYKQFRKFAPKAIRSSGFYNRYVKYKRQIKDLLHLPHATDEEQLIQDWEVPWQHAKELTKFALEHVELDGLPWIALPIKALGSPSCYPLKTGEMYYNLGCYCYTQKPRPDIDFYYTKIMDKTCFELDGIKMLYSSTFIDKSKFDQIYNGQAYLTLKQKYDPENYAASLFEKATAGA